jgi:sulfatase maturation enzyme AslB (radical SAM superfamily)
MLTTHPKKSKETAFVFNVTNRFDRIRYLRNIYWKLVSKGLYKIGVTEMIRTQFPYYLPDTDIPPSLNVEFTNHCQLQCTYCTSPLKLRPTGFMSEDTFENLNDQIVVYNIKRIRVVGNGEPTVHPQFPRMIRQLSKT